MELLTTFLLVTSSIFGAIVLRLISGEVKSWLPVFALRIIERSIRLLPKQDRARRREEWLADNNDMPGKLSKFCHALGCCKAAGIVAWPESLARLLSIKPRPPKAAYDASECKLKLTLSSYPSHYDTDDLFAVLASALESEILASPCAYRSKECLPTISVQYRRVMWSNPQKDVQVVIELLSRLQKHFW
jgi:hypothetical protein